MNKNIKAIDIIKAFAIFSVLIIHLYIPQEVTKKYFLYLYTVIGVPIFMIITGHNYTLSVVYSNSKEFSLKTYFDRFNFYKKIKRLVVPYIYILLLEFYFLFTKQNFIKYRNKESLIELFVKGGGIGPGSYYTPVLVQIIFIYFPILLLFNKYLKKLIVNSITRSIISLFITIVLEIIYEIIINYFGNIDKELIQEVYRISAFRYLPFLQLGIILYYNKEQLVKNLKYILPFSIGGGYYIYLTFYKNYTIFPFYYWKVVAIPVIFYALFFIIIALKYLNNINNNIFEKFIRLIGKSSYHIFLVQMIYYGMLRINSFNKGIYYIVHIFICLSVGIIFYYIEPKITERLILFIKKIFRKEIE